MKKRLLSAFLALAMMLTLLPVSAFAATEDSIAASGTATITFGTSLEPSGGWKNGDSVSVTSKGGTTNLNLNFTYSAPGADTAVIAKPDNGGTVARTEEQSSDASADSRIVAASTTVDLPRFFAIAGTFSESSGATFDGTTTVTVSVAADATRDSLGTVSATVTQSGDTPGTSVTALSVQVVTPQPPATTPDDAGVTTPNNLPNNDATGYLPGTGLTTVTPAEGTSVTRATATDDNRYYGRWYWTTRTGNTTVYNLAPAGIVVGNKWYSDPVTYANMTTGGRGKYPGTFTIVGNKSVALSKADASVWPTSLKVELDGGSLTGLDNLPSTVTSVTVNNDVKYGGMATSSISIGNVARVGTGNSFTLKVTNASVGAINLTDGANTVTLVGGDVGAIAMNGNYTDPRTGRTTSNRQTLGINSENGTTSAYNTILKDDITIEGDSSSIALHNATGTGHKVTYTGNQGTITVSGTSNLGAISYATHVGAPSTSKNVNPANVTVKGGTIASITNTDAYSTGTATITVGQASVGGITINRLKGKVTVNAGTTGNGDITIPEGELTINGTIGDPTKVGDIKIGTTAGTTSKITIGGGSVTGGSITSLSGSKLTISIPKPENPATHPYVFGDLTLTGYTGHGIKGGTFQCLFDDAAKKQWIDTDLAFRVNLNNVPNVTGGDYWTLYGSKELGQAFSDVGKANAYQDAAVNAKVVLTGQTATKFVKLMNGKNGWGTIGYSASSTFLLPTMMFGTPVPEWVYETGGQNGTVVKDNRITTPGTPMDITVTSKRSIDIATGITSIVSNPMGVKAVLSGNVINLSGAVYAGDGGEISSIYLTLGTNIEDEAGKAETSTNATGYKKAVVEVNYNVKTKETHFNSAWGVWMVDPSDPTKYIPVDPSLGITVAEDKLYMNDGKVVYTVNGSGLGVPASNLNVFTASKEVQASVTKNGATEAAKQALVAAIAGSGAEFEWNDAYAIWEGVNAALKTYGSDSTVTSWITNAQSTIWRNGLKDPVTGAWVQVSSVTLAPHTGTFTSNSVDYGTITAAFNTAYLVPYLQVNVTDYTSDYTTITANLVPSYRIIISKAGYTTGDPYYVVSGQSGKSLGTLTGSMTGGVKLKFAQLSTIGKWAHQDATYGYQQDATDNSWTIDHVGAKDGLGTFVFNSNEPLVKLTHKKDAYNAKGDKLSSGGEDHYYDTLQAAVDDTLPQPQTEGSNTTAGVHDTSKCDEITVDGRYQGSYSITVSGLARTFVVKVEGEKQLSATGSRVTSTKTNANEWTVQLLEDTGVVTNSNITITDVTGGSASVSSNPAAEGQTVTITLVPNTGYIANGVSVRKPDGTVVAVSGSGNTYRFVMPAGSVTVTPAFIVGTAANAPTSAIVTVNSSTMGSATTTALTGQVTGGSTVGVTTYPNAGYRTMGVNVSTNYGSTTATRTGSNSFSFTVPTNATAVTVNPVYDRDNGTLFEDVWSTSYYSNAVAWAVSMGIIGGQSTYSFGSNYNCKRADMMVMLYRAAGSPSVSGVYNPFVDVQPSDYYYNAVMWAYSKGITGGVDSTHFGPSQSVNRAQTVTFLYRYAGEPAVGTNSGFYDVPSNQYYAKAVTWAVSKGITNGKSATSFAPGSSCLRAEIATFLYRDFTGVRA